MRFVLAAVAFLFLAGVAMADMPPGGWHENPRLAAPGGWCGGLMGGLTAGLAVTSGGLWLARRKRSG